MLVVSGVMLLDLRREAWDKAGQTSINLLQVIERDIARNVEIFDLSLQGVVENLRTPGIDAIGPAMRQLVLFDRAATARDMGAMFVLDEHGDVTVDAGALPPRKGNYADRDYFRAHRERPGLGLFIGRPLVSKISGERMLPFSRRLNKPDGSFGGVALGSLKLGYFLRLFDRLGLGQQGAVSLYMRDGTRVMRYPYAESEIGRSVAGTPTFERFVDERSGTFVDTSAQDRIKRHHTFTQVGDLPLILDVAMAIDGIEAGWRAKAIVIGVAVIAMCGLTVILSLLYGLDLRRRDAMQAELAHLSHTEP